LKHKNGAGRHRILNPSEVTRYIRQPIARKNRSHRAVHYTDLFHRVRENSGREVSLRTIQRYGKEDAKVKMRRTKKCTVDECQFISLHIRVMSPYSLSRYRHSKVLCYCSTISVYV
jgi:hypothetical protein